LPVACQHSRVARQLLSAACHCNIVSNLSFVSNVIIVNAVSNENVSISSILNIMNHVNVTSIASIVNIICTV
jgi:hypothetical protein